MRRFFAFILMIVTVVSAIIFNTQSVFQSGATDNDFGEGKEIVYKISPRVNEKDPDINDATNQVIKRLDAIGAKNYQVHSEGDTQFRVIFSPQTTTDLMNVTRMIESNGELSICTASDYCLNGSEYFSDTASTLIYQGIVPFPGFNAISTEAHQKLVDNNKAEEGATDAADFIIWRNRQADDTFEGSKLNTEEGKAMKKRIVANAPVANWDANSLKLYLNSDLDGANFSISSGRSFVATMNSADYGFEIEKLYTNNVPAILGADGLNKIYLGVGIGLLVLSLILILSYGYSGLISLVSIISGLLLQLMVCAFLGFELSPASIMGIFVMLSLATFASVTYFERIREELKKGKSIEKANKEGYHKSFSVLIDSGIIVSLVSLFTFLLGKGSIKTFAGTAFIGALAAIIVVNLLMKWMMYWLTSSSVIKFNERKFGFGMFTIPLTIKDNCFEGKKYRKKLSISSIIASSLLIVSSLSLLIFGIVDAPFNNAGTFSSYGRINIVLNNTDEFKKNDDFIIFLDTHEIEIDYTAISVVTVDNGTIDIPDKTTYISVSTAKRVTDHEITDNLEILMKNIDEEATVESVRAVSKTASTYISNLFLVLGLSLLFGTIYMMIRFYFAMSIASLATNIVAVMSGIGMLSLFRIPFNSYTGFALLASAIVISFFSIGIFARIKDIQKDRRIKHPTHEQRCETASEALKLSLQPLLYIMITILFISVCALVFAPAELIEYFLVFIITTLIGGALSIFFLVPMYLFIRKHVKFKEVDWSKYTKFLHIKRKKKPVVNKPKEPMETIVPGIND